MSTDPEESTEKIEGGRVDRVESELRALHEVRQEARGAGG